MAFLTNCLYSADCRRPQPIGSGVQELKATTAGLKKKEKAGPLVFADIVERVHELSINFDALGSDTDRACAVRPSAVSLQYAFSIVRDYR
jgi:hypothetical protein